MPQTAPARELPRVTAFFDSVNDAAVAAGGGRRKITEDIAQSLLGEKSTAVPAVLGDLLSKMPEERHADLLDSVSQGIQRYTKEHGRAPGADLIDATLRSAALEFAPVNDLRIEGLRLDAATNTASDTLALQANRAIVSVMAQFPEAMPFAAYLPVDLQSNKSILAIMTNEARSDFGDYTSGASLDGIAGGGSYLQSERIVTISTTGGLGTATAFAFTTRTSTGSTMPLLRGRTKISVNGLLAASEAASNSGSGASAIAGNITLGGVTYTLTGTINTDTGVGSITSAPALPATVTVTAAAFVNYEAQPSLAPKVGVTATTFDIFAFASRGLLEVSIDAATQMARELGLDPRAYASLLLRNQVAQERHKQALAKLKLVALNNTDTWAYGYGTQIAQKDRSQIWRNLHPILGAVSQKMANATINHGVDTLYLTGELASQVTGLPATDFVPSGISKRPGIYRLGRLWDTYEVYYTPYLLTETGNGDTSQILAIGRGTETARSPIICGDAVAPMLLELAMGQDLKYSNGYYQRSYTELNPHIPSAQGAALINVTGIKS